LTACAIPAHDGGDGFGQLRAAALTGRTDIAARFAPSSSLAAASGRRDETSGATNARAPCNRPVSRLYEIRRYLAGRLGRFAASTARTFQTFSPRSTNRDANRDDGHEISCARSRVHAVTKGYFMHTGTVKFYNDQKGFGFIQPDNGEKDVFVHATALERAGINGLREGQKVAFDTQNDPRSGKIAVSKIEVA
jgi:cold shock protein